MSDQKQSDSFNDIAEEYDERALSRAFSDASKDVLLSKEWFNSQSQGGTLLDFGCGTGLNTIGLSDYFERITSVDIAENMISVLMRKVEEKGLGEKVKGIVISEEPANDVEGTFDVVLISLVLHHAAEPAKTVNFLCSVCADGGRVVIIEFNPPHGHLNSEEEPELSQEILDAFESQGFTFESTDYFLVENTETKPLGNHGHSGKSNKQTDNHHGGEDHHDHNHQDGHNHGVRVLGHNHHGHNHGVGLLGHHHGHNHGVRSLGHNHQHEQSVIHDNDHGNGHGHGHGHNHDFSHIKNFCLGLFVFKKN